jgi:hypothetical protein
MEIREILDRVNRATGQFEGEAVEAAIFRQDEIIPELLRILENSVATLEKGGAQAWSSQIDPHGDYTAHLYAMFILGELRETLAHELLLGFALLPAALFESVCGGFTSELSHALQRTAENTTGLRGIIENRAAHEDIRIDCLESLGHLVGRERVSREEVLWYLAELFNGKLERTPSDLWICIVFVSLELSAVELMVEIRRAIDDGLVSTEFNWDEIEEAFGFGWEDFGRVFYEAFAEKSSLERKQFNAWWTRAKCEPLQNET